jgi:DNA-binding GntR family transcriptional regulator
MAVTRLQNEEIFRELEASLDRALNSELGLPEIITTDLQFHRLLVKSCGNSKLLEMWDQLAGQLRLALVMIEPKFFREEFVVKTHYRQISAMRRGDFGEVQSLIGRFDEVAQSLKQRWDSVQ